MKIDVPITDHFGKVMAVVKGTIVDVAPHLPMVTWALVDVRQFAPYVYVRWNITNLETGSSYADLSGRTKAECIRNATEFLANISSAKMTRALNKRHARRNHMREST